MAQTTLQPSPEDINFIMSLRDDEDVRAEALLNLATGMPLLKSIRHARCKIARDLRWDGITAPRDKKDEAARRLYKQIMVREKQAGKSDEEAAAAALAVGGKPTHSPNFDYLDHIKNDGDMSPHERLSQTVDPETRMSLMQELDSVSEQMLNFVNAGTRVIGGALGVGQRQAQNLVVKQCKRIVGEQNFKRGGAGQGGLFGFGTGEVA